MEDQIIRQSTHKARKVHTCKICRKEISKGTKYSLTVGIFDGRLLESIHNHTVCLSDRAEYINDQKRKEGCGEWGQQEF
jgi:hypothetical protein